MRRTSGSSKRMGVRRAATWGVRRAATWVVFSLLGVATAWAGGACSISFPSYDQGFGGGPGEDTESGPSTGFTGTGTPADAGAGGASTCDIVDGVCSPMAGENCGCVDCAGTAICNADQCVSDGICDQFDDSCICPDCDNTHYCGDPAKKNCTDDGVCDSFYEGCGCADCGAKTHCKALLATCAAGHLDGTCAADEPCTCPDCFGLAQCVTCQSPGVCSPGDPCSCPGCEATPVCSDPKGCISDGVCDILDEGCACADCVKTPACQGGSGAGSSGSGSAGSATGSAGSAGP